MKISTSFICRQTTLKKYAVFCPQKTERIFMHFQGQLWQTEVCKKAIAEKNEVEREFLCIFANKIQNWKWIHPYATIIPALLKQSHRKTIQCCFGCQSSSTNQNAGWQVVKAERSHCRPKLGNPKNNKYSFLWVILLPRLPWNRQNRKPSWLGLFWSSKTLWMHFGSFRLLFADVLLHVTY